MENLIEFLKDKSKVENQVNEIISELQKKYMLKDYDIEIYRGDLGFFEIKVTL